MAKSTFLSQYLYFIERLVLSGRGTLGSFFNSYLPRGTPAQPGSSPLVLHVSRKARMGFPPRHPRRPRLPRGPLCSHHVISREQAPGSSIWSTWGRRGRGGGVGWRPAHRAAIPAGGAGGSVESAPRRRALTAGLRAGTRLREAGSGGRGAAGMAGPGWGPPRLDGFILTERLGSGTYATVYKAYAKVGAGRGAPGDPGAGQGRGWGTNEDPAPVPARPRASPGGRPARERRDAACEQ